MKYDPAKIEPKWQQAWEDHRVFRTPSDPKELQNKPKFYILDMFPYPSGAGLHVGHPEGYTATDVVARYKRMRGFNVLHPMGWDSFGLPAERAALREHKGPAEITERNIANFRRQINRLGFSYDWEREITTSSPEYYRWTQWIFLKLLEKGLAYRAEVPVNWCPALGTVLANEEVKDGRYVETGDPVERRLMKQWMLKITEYAERLLKDLDEVDWPEGVKEMQRNWIGKSEGAVVDFSVADAKESFSVFTTRPDTLYGATYCVLAPEHPLVPKLLTPPQRAAAETYILEAKNKSDLLRTELTKMKTGIFTGSYAVHPITRERIPIWIADYVLMTYGFGAIMAVPAHDQRDHDFAKKFGLPMIEVVSGADKPVMEEAFEGEGVAVNSPIINGLKTDEAKKKIIQYLEQNQLGKMQIQYKLRDWLFSRQRYWGEPFPIVHLSDGSIVPIPADQLPVALPPIDQYKPTRDGQPPLARATEWLGVTLPDGRHGVRETNTMPQWAGSCWYYLRYLDPKNDQAPFSPAAERYWMPVDLYIGGVEHAVLHLLYARFWHKVLYDCDLVHTKEPFQKLFNQGMILAYSYRDPRGKYHHPKDIEEKNGKPVLKSTGEPVETQIEKMSKSKLNVVNPDEVIDRYGADAMRLYELFMGPLEAVKPWQMDGVEGVYRFLGRVWRLVREEVAGNLNPKLCQDPPESAPELNKILHQTLKKVTEDIEGMRFNTAISQMMIFCNEAGRSEKIPAGLLKIFLKVLSPFAPHLAEELWQQLGETEFICRQTWPRWNPQLLEENTIPIIIQVNGKKRGKVEVAKEADRATVEAAALADEAIQRFIAGKKPKKVIVVPGRLVNIVV